jgi:hypothetical protein
MARKVTKWEFFKDGERYLATQGESPKGFKDLLFVALGGSIDKIEEMLVSRNNLAKMTRVDTVPEDWARAFQNYGVPFVSAPQAIIREQIELKLVPEFSASNYLTIYLQLTGILFILVTFAMILDEILK